MVNRRSQGPRAGRNWPSEDERYRDPTSGARVRRLTSYPGVDDYHCYFTTDGVYDDGRRLLFRSDRGGSRDLHSIDLETGLITQLTDLEGFAGETAIDHDRRTLYFWVDDALVRFDLDSLRVVETVFEVPAGYEPGSLDVNADGSTLYVSVGEAVEVPAEFADSKLEGVFRAEPNTLIYAVPVDGEAEPELLVDVDCWASSHVNASPTRSELFVYCEEGPWAEVEHRIRTVNAETGERWRVRPVPPEGGVGHEYWMQDGERIGYHGALRDPQATEGVDDPQPFVGSARYDDTDRRETDLPDELYAVTHSHGNSPERLVCDGTVDEAPYTLLYEWNGDAGEYEGPRILATHDWRESSPHPHSRFTPDGSTVLFDSGRHDGASNVYAVTVPAFEELPEYDPGTA